MMNVWWRRIGVYLFGIFLGLLLVSRFPSRHEVKVSDFHASFDHQQLAKAHWVNVSRQLNPDDFAGRMILLFFVGPNCPRCEQFSGNVQAWQKRFGDDLSLLPVWEGSVASDIPTFLSSLPVLLDENRNMQQNFALQQLPAFALIRPDGQRLAIYVAEDAPKVLEDLAYLHQLFLHKIKNSPMNW